VGLKAQILTPLGPIRLILFPDRAPHSVASFLAHIDEGHFDTASFYRACRPDTELDPSNPAVLLQGGMGFTDPSPLPRIPHESPADSGLMPDRGTIALARHGPGTACSEFFLNLADNLSMRPGGGRGDNLGVAVFGMVESGLDIADQLLASPAGTSDESYPPAVWRQILNPPIPIRVQRS
jgi:cyclophilin family peptidyl-prolyl cis-trans isomerase